MHSLILQAAVLLTIGAGRYDGIGARYQSDELMWHAAAVHGYDISPCMMSSDFHKLGTWVIVESKINGLRLWCQVVDLSQTVDRNRHMRDHLFEFNPEAAERLFGPMPMANRDCPLWVSH